MPLREDLLQPISGANPAGVTLRYDPMYDKIKEARREEEDVDQGDWKRPRKVADWPLVIKLASDALATRSKDLWIAAWLTEALLKQEGLGGGLRAGLGLLQGLLETFWDHLYPELEDGDAELRAAPLNWVGRYLDAGVKTMAVTKAGHDHLKYKESRAVGSEADAKGDEKKQAARAAAISDHKLTAEEFDKAFDATPKPWYKQLVRDLDGCLQAVQGLDEVGRQKFGDAAPSYGTLVQALEEVQDVARQLLEKKLQMDPDPLDAVPAEGPGSAAAGAARAGGALAPEPTSVEDAAARIASAARFLRHLDPRNPAPYLMIRGFRWGELRASGADVDPKLLAAPPTAVRTTLKSLLLDGKWAELLDAGENVMATPNGRGWLDLQRYELTACQMLGADHQYVAAALKGALFALLRDFPQLPDLTLMDDTATANVETRAWLQNGGFLAAAAQEGAEERARPEPSPAETRPRFGRPAFERAMAEARAGRPQKGIELLMREAEGETSARARFLRRSEAAQIMVDTGLETVALPILKELLEQVEAHKLEDWEAGDAVARPMGLLYRCLEKLGGDADMKDSLYRQICRLDPLQAIAFPVASPSNAASPSNDGASGG
jgi:type VI secretion system protein ImpA